MKIRPSRCRSCHERAQLRRTRARVERFIEAVIRFNINADEVALSLERATWAIRSVCMRMFLIRFGRAGRHLLPAVCASAAAWDVMERIKI